MLIGWLSSRMIAEDKRELPTLMLLGIVGGIVGGAIGIMLHLQSSSHASNFSIVAFVISMVGAVGLIGLYKNISPQN